MERKINLAMLGYIGSSKRDFKLSVENLPLVIMEFSANLHATNAQEFGEHVFFNFFLFCTLN